MAVLIELSRNFPKATELMWNAEDAVAVSGFLLHRAAQPGAAYTQLGPRIPNIPGGTLNTRADMVLGGNLNLRPHKIHHQVEKDPDLTWYYKIQRVLRNGSIHPDDTPLADLTPRTILSFEETHDYFGVQGPSRTVEHKRLTVTVPNGSTFAGTPFVYDFINLHGRPAFRIRFRAIDPDCLMKTNNVNNLPITIPVKTDDFTWDDLYDESYGGVWLQRLLFENTTGGDIDVDLDYSHGVQ